MSDNQGDFTFGSADLSDEAKERIDRWIDSLKEETGKLFVEIEGHADRVDDANANYSSASNEVKR